MESTVVLNFLAMEYRLSPFFTIYILLVLGADGLVGTIFEVAGIFNFWPICKLVFGKLFNIIMAEAVVLYLLAMEYRLSPLFTVYVVATGVVFVSGGI